MHQGSLRYSEADQQYITACLGRTPKGVVGVAARGANGEPTVIINLPLTPHGETWQPFPTLYWLVDPDLNNALSDIERKGGVREIERAIANDPSLAENHRADNACYAASRWAVLNAHERQAANELGMSDALKLAGIGGVANHNAIKCLHAQYAFHLARHNKGTTAGHLVHQHYNL